MPLNLSSECCVSQGPMARHQTPTSWPRPSNHFHLRLWWHTPWVSATATPSTPGAAAPYLGTPSSQLGGSPQTSRGSAHFSDTGIASSLCHICSSLGRGPVHTAGTHGMLASPQESAGLCGSPSGPLCPPGVGQACAGAPQWPFGPPGMNQQVPHWLVRDFLVLDSGSF